MKFDELYGKLSDQAYFDFNTVALFFPMEGDANLRTALYRFAKDGKLLSLRRGLYAFAPPFRKNELHGASAANILYAPSYLSELWALSWYGIIPEKTVMFTSVSPRSTCTFQNELGQFRYRSLKQELFFGYVKSLIQNQDVAVAEPEKALLDLWYLEAGEWSVGRMEGMRFDPKGIDSDVLETHSARFASARIDRAVHSWRKYSGGYFEGDRIV